MQPCNRCGYSATLLRANSCCSTSTKRAHPSLADVDWRRTLSCACAGGPTLWSSSAYRTPWVGIPTEAFTCQTRPCTGTLRNHALRHASTALAVITSGSTACSTSGIGASLPTLRCDRTGSASFEIIRNPSNSDSTRLKYANR